MFKNTDINFNIAAQNALIHYLMDIKKDVATLKENDEKNGDMIYQMLDHLATNNNSGGMKKALDDYNKFFRHN